MKRFPVALFGVALLLCLACDQATKQVAASALAATGPVSLAGDVVRLELASNPGAFLSLGSGLPPQARRIVFLVVVPLALALIAVLFLRTRQLGAPQLLGLGLLAGGGLGNWLDRLLNSGSVIDFVSLGVGPLRTGIFNVADVAIVLGALLLALGPLRNEGPEEPPAA